MAVFDMTRPMMNVNRIGTPSPGAGGTTDGRNE